MLTTATMHRRPTSPGEMLLEEFLKPAGITQLALAKKMGVPIQRVNGVVSGRRAVTAETAILLSRVLGTTPALWLNLQVAVDLWDAQQRLGDQAGSHVRGHVSSHARKPTPTARRGRGARPAPHATAARTVRRELSRGHGPVRPDRGQD